MQGARDRYRIFVEAHEKEEESLSVANSNNLLSFTKMHGLGNDFMVLDKRDCPEPLSAQQVARWADRNLGVGFDQLLVLSPSEISGIDVDFLIYNADGGEVAQCGNGARCAALYAFDHKMIAAGSVVFKTHRAVMQAEVMSDRTVCVRMPAPNFSPDALPFTAQWSQTEGGLYLPDGQASGLCFDIVDIGNPHVVIQVPSLAAAPVLAAGAYLERHAQFPNGTNVNFVEVLDAATIQLQTFERGVGLTRACGSGACATVAALRRQGRVAESVQVQMAVGNLDIRWTGQVEDPIFMQGSATYVFKGEIPWS